MPMTESASAQSARFTVLKVAGAKAQEESATVRVELETDGNASRNSAEAEDEVFKQSEYYKTCGEVLPRPSNYRMISEETFKRPTIDQLHESALFTAGDSAVAPQANPDLFQEDAEEEGVVKKDKYAPIKLGWIKGILIRCILTIWGVLLFVRLTWIVGQAGICLATVIIVLSTVVTLITTMSLSAICTNGEVLGGGIYFLISRCLGPEFGSIVGIIFSFANVVGIAMHVVGFAETVVDIFERFAFTLTGDETNDVRVVGVITVLLLLGIAIIGVRWESAAQVVLMVLLVCALINYAIGCFIPPTEDKQAKGFRGFSTAVFVDNFGPSFREQHTFFTVFSIFFPAATGILSGINISGDLKDPSSAVPKGTFLAIIITSATYLIVAWTTGASVDREILYQPSLNATSPAGSFNGSLELSSLNSTMELRSNRPQMYGLLHHMQVIEMMSWYGPIIFAGIFAASLSSALAALVAAPKLFQAVSKDRLFPYIHVFAKEYGRDREPRRAYLLCAFLACCFTAVGKLNVIGPIVSNFYMVTYIFVNYSCFDASTSKTPGWRPGFKYYNRWISLLGALMCLTIVFIMSWWSGLLTFLVAGFLWFYVHYNKPQQANWGSSRDANTYRSAVSLAHRLVGLTEHVKNFRPQVLVLCGEPHKRPQLVDFANALTKDVGLLLCANVVQDDLIKFPSWKLLSCEGYTYLRHRKIKSFYDVVISRDFRDGAKCVLQAAGLGKLRPNIVLLGYKENWHTRCGESAKEVEDFVNIVHDAFDLHYGVAVLRLNNGFDSRDMDGVTLSEFLEMDLKAKRLFKTSQRAKRHLHKRGPGNASLSTMTTIAGNLDNRNNCEEVNPMRTPPKRTRRAVKVSVSTLSSSSSSSSDDEDPPSKLFGSKRSTKHKRHTESLSEDDAQDVDFSKRRHTLLETIKRRASLLNSQNNATSESEVDLKSSLHVRPAQLSASRMTINVDVVEEVGSCSESTSSSSQMIHRISKSNASQKTKLQNRAKYVDDTGERWVDVINRFVGRQRPGFIDIWWLFDDGGLTLLLPHILSTRSLWNRTKLRIITQPTSEQIDDDGIAKDRRKMLELFAKFRFEIEDVRVLRMNDPPSARTVSEFDRLLEAWRVRPTGNEQRSSAQPWLLTNEELQAVRSKTMRYLRIRELLGEYSSDAQLIVVTLPVPRKGLSPALYFSWIEMLTKDLPVPVLLVRGNQQTVLTYCS